MWQMFVIDSEHLRRWRAGVLTLGLAALLWLPAQTGPWRGVDNRLFDLFTSLSAPHTSSLPVVILAIDEPSFSQLQQQWPFPRRWHAQVLQRLQADGARAVGFDVLFAEPSNPVDDAALAQAIAGGPPVVLGALRERTDSANAELWTEVAPLEPLLQAGAVPGQTGVTPDDDFVVRLRDGADDSFALRLARAAQLALAPQQAHAPGSLRIGYAGPRGSFDTRSYYQALEPGLLPAGFFKDKIVLIGRSVRSASELDGAQADMFNSPFAALGHEDRLFPGVELQANLLANAVLGNGLRAATVPEQLTLQAALLLLVLLLPARWHPGWVAAAMLAVLTGTLAGTLWLFVQQRLWLPPLLPLASTAAAYGSGLLLNYLAARERASQTRRMFSQYVPPEVVAELVEHPHLLKLGGEERALTLMFTDLANFTGMSEHLSAPATVEVLTEYFNTMTDIIHRHGGTVDKFIGDAVMAFWGAPLPDTRHAEHAVRAAIEMQAAMQAMTERLLARGLPRIAMRIGLHSGSAVVGNVGSRTRFSYTAIGDTVNLAARLEGANKAFGSGILLSDATAQGLPADIGLRPLDTVIVKGKTEPIGVFTPCADAPLCALGSAIVSSFAQQHWDDCANACRQLLQRKPADLAAERFLQRLTDLRATGVAPDWTPSLALDKL